jgi:alkanesulfonate monooxygenase SsuD/methylene tetrahydromethanopterin reductase-like flavin-dependent oxidoreductase (luciferase family)
MALEIGFLIPPTPRGSTLEAMASANDRLLAACRDHDLTAWFVDHFQFAERPYLECFAHLAHSAGRFQGIRVGTLVLGQGYRNPALVAKVAATLQLLTGGKFILGIGAGWKEDEYHAYGWPFPSTGQRLDELDEAIRIIKLLWTDAPVSFKGKHYQIADAICEPRPDPHPILMVGGGGEKRTLRIAAEHADWWNVDYVSPETYAHKLNVLHGHCESLGRDPKSIVPTAFCLVSVSHDESKFVRIPPSNYPPTSYIINGSPGEVIEKIQAFEAIGVQHMQVTFLDYPKLDGIELFLKEVLPTFAK